MNDKILEYTNNIIDDLYEINNIIKILNRIIEYQKTNTKSLEMYVSKIYSCKCNIEENIDLMEDERL